MKSRVLLIAACLALAAGCSRKAPLITGETDAAEVDVGVKIAGRIAKIDVREGDAVRKGQILGNLESREMEARLQTVRAACAEAREQFDLADKTFKRIENLYKTGVLPRQQMDEARYKFEAAKQKVAATEGQLNEVLSYYGEMLIKAPIDGEVVQVVSRAGEIVSPGYPVITIVDLNDQWVVFNLREDRMPRVHKGSKLAVSFPALGKSYPFTVTVVSALGQFAKWKATNELGSFDLKTFETRARADGPVENMRPGMTALIALENEKQ